MPAIAQQPGQAGAAPMQPVRILLVDDHPAMLRQLAQMLPEGFEVVEMLESGKGVPAAIAKHHPDIIVIDVTMPEQSGIQVASQLRRAGDETKIVFLTMHNDPDYARAAFEAGGSAYVVKMRMANDLGPALQAVTAGERFISPSPELKEVRVG